MSYMICHTQEANQTELESKWVCSFTHVVEQEKSTIVFSKQSAHNRRYLSRVDIYLWMQNAILIHHIKQWIVIPVAECVQLAEDRSAWRALVSVSVAAVRQRQLDRALQSAAHGQTKSRGFAIWGRRCTYNY